MSSRMGNEPRNYPELKAYLGSASETQITLQVLLRILDDELADCEGKKNFNMLDVGCSDGELTFPLVKALKKRIPKLKVTAIEPETPAFQEFQKSANVNGFIKLENVTIQEFLRDGTDSKPVFDLLLLSQCWYHFPRKDWDFILNGVLSLLRRGGLAVIVLDSHEGEVYELKDLITRGTADTLEYGDLFSAEDVEALLKGRRIVHRVVEFPIFISVKNHRQYLDDYAKMLSFLYRTFPHKILRYKCELKRFLAKRLTGDRYFVENRLKAIVVRS